MTANIRIPTALPLWQLRFSVAAMVLKSKTKIPPRPRMVPIVTAACYFRPSKRIKYG
jgi:hypothetical protein